MQPGWSCELVKIITRSAMFTYLLVEKVILASKTNQWSVAYLRLLVIIVGAASRKYIGMDGQTNYKWQL